MRLYQEVNTAWHWKTKIEPRRTTYIVVVVDSQSDFPTCPIGQFIVIYCQQIRSEAIARRWVFTERTRLSTDDC